MPVEEYLWIWAGLNIALTTPMAKFFLISISLWVISGMTSASFAAPKVRSEELFVEKIIQYADNVPQNKKQVIEDLLHDLGMGDSQKLQDMIASPSADLYKYLIKGFLGGEDPENLVQLMEELQRNDVETLNFLSALRNQVQSDPEKLQRVQNSLNMVYADLLATPVRTPSFGIRSLQATMIFLGGASLQLSIFPSLMQQYMSGDKYVFLIPQVLLAGLLVTSTAAEFRVLTRTWKDYKQSLRRRIHVEKNLKFFSKIINGLKEAPHLLPTLDRLRFITSKDSVFAAKEAAMLYPQLLTQQLEDLKQDPSVFAQYQRFFYTQNFYQLVQDLNKRLSATEKQELIELAKTKGEIPLPLNLQIDLLNYENQVQIEFENWMNIEEQKTFIEKYRRILAKRRQFSEMTQDYGVPRNAYFITTAAISIGLGLISLSDASLGHSLYGFSWAHDLVAQFFNTYRPEVLTTAAGLVIGALGFQVYSTQKLWWKLRSQMSYKHEMDLEKLNSLSQLLPRWTKVLKPIERCADLVGED